MDAHINPDLLLWARQTAGLSIEDLARRTGIALARLVKAEAGETPLTTIQLEKVAAICRRPVAAFYLPRAPAIPVAIPDFRRLPEGGLRSLSTELRLEIRRAQQRRQETLDLAEELEEDLPIFDLSFSLDLSPHEASKKLRDYMRISVEEQISWGKPEKALKEWKKAAEAIGVMVFEVSRIPVSEMRGVALSLSPLPIAILNGADEASARIFSLIHELAHLALNVSAIDSGAFDEDGLAAQEARTEKFCNEVAGEFLVPILSVQKFLEARQNSVLDLALVAAIAKHFSVSRQVVARRLQVRGHINPAQYRQWHQQLKEEYEQYLKDRKAKIKANKSGPPFEVIQARNLSQTFVRVAFNAYDQDHLSLNGVSGLLGLKVKGVFALRNLVKDGAEA
ncbi:MAG: ImmA/IrrE family metallo-endopeptidase [Ramlibacter sp.]|nr:ImmA/IrrE family metallo-endopeptidase [Ramlibacter sp.]